MKLIYCAAWIAVMSIALSCNSVNNDTSPKLTKTGIELAEVKEYETNYKPGIMKMAGGETADSTVKQEPPGNGNPRKQPSAPQQNIDWDKKIVKNASINAEVKDYKNFYASLREKIKSVGGYIAQEEQNQSDYKIENSLAIKVPVDQFDNALVQLTANTDKINEKKITSSDVTTEVVDTRSRMEAKRQVRARYLDLLKQAKNMEDILNVQNEINGVQEEIESAAGRIEYLNHASAFSTINMTFFQVLNVSAKDKDNPGFGTKLTNAFSIGSNWISDLFIGLVSIWPLFLVVAFVVIVYRRTKGRKEKPYMKQPASEVVS
jgi:hypothetical protein